MKYIGLVLFVFASLNLNAQNTRLVFNDNPVASTSFDGDYMAFYNPDDAKKNEDIILPFQKYHSNGQLAEVGLIVNNKPEGLWKKYNEEGKLIAKIRYCDGVKTGKWIIWSKEGKVLSKGRYDKFGSKKGNWVVWSNTDEKYLENSY
jgi:antitoxin component YwqK of YwqJK toxin-antitoxin module